MPLSKSSCLRLGRSGALVAALWLTTGCALIKHSAINSVAATLSETGTTVTSDNDPTLIGDAFPFTIKLYESLLASIPNNREFLVANCSLDTEYAYAYLSGKADELGEAHHDEVKVLRDRALKMYLRGKGYCMRAMELRFKGITPPLLSNPDQALARVKNKKDVELLYWTAASWGGAISLGKDQPDIVIDFPSVRALADRALALDETWNKGAIHEMMITLDSLPPALGGDPAKARDHFKRAVELQHGLSPGPYVSLALNVSQPAQNKAEFVSLLNQALAIDPEKDPDNRLITLLEQERARALLAQIDTLFASAPQPAGSSGRHGR